MACPAVSVAIPDTGIGLPGRLPLIIVRYCAPFPRPSRSGGQCPNLQQCWPQIWSALHPPSRRSRWASVLWSALGSAHMLPWAPTIAHSLGLHVIHYFIFSSRAHVVIRASVRGPRAMQCVAGTATKKMTGHGRAQWRVVRAAIGGVTSNRRCSIRGLSSPRCVRVLSRGEKHSLHPRVQCIHHGKVFGVQVLGDRS